jgi:hypothetical protein
MFGSRKQSLKINKIQKHLRFSDYYTLKMFAQGGLFIFDSSNMKSL